MQSVVFFSRDIVSSVRINLMFGMLFATLERRRELEPKCVSQLFLGSLLETRQSAIGHFFPPGNSPRSLRES